MPEAFFRPRPFGLPNLAPFEHSATGPQTPGRDFLNFKAYLDAEIAATVGKPLGLLETIADRNQGFLHDIRYDARQRGDEAIYDITTRLFFAHEAYAYSYFHPAWQYHEIERYNQMQEPYTKQGQPLRGVELSVQETQLLREMLDEVSVPHDLKNITGPVCIPFTPLEHTMRLALTDREVMRGVSNPTIDHEERMRRDIRNLLNDWKQNEQGNQ